MLELICKIPDHTGWMMVGALGMVCVMMGWKLGKLIYDSIKERLEDDGECEDYSSHFSISFFGRAPTGLMRGIRHNPQGPTIL